MLTGLMMLLTVCTAASLRSGMGGPTVPTCSAGSAPPATTISTGSFPCRGSRSLSASSLTPKTLLLTSQRALCTTSIVLHTTAPTSSGQSTAGRSVPAPPALFTLPPTLPGRWGETKRWGRKATRGSASLSLSLQGSVRFLCWPWSIRKTWSKITLPRQKKTWSISTTLSESPPLDAKVWWAARRAPSNQTASPTPQQSPAAARTPDSPKRAERKTRKVRKTPNLATGRSTSSSCWIRALKRRRWGCGIRGCVHLRDTACNLTSTPVTQRTSTRRARTRATITARTYLCPRPAVLTTSSAGEALLECIAACYARTKCNKACQSMCTKCEEDFRSQKTEWRVFSLCLRFF